MGLYKLEVEKCGKNKCEGLHVYALYTQTEIRSLYLRLCLLLTARVKLYKIITQTYLAHLIAWKMGNIKYILPYFLVQKLHHDFFVSNFRKK